MRKTLLLLLSTLILVLSSGFTTYSHICKGVVQYVGTEQLLEEREGCSFCAQKGEQVADNLTNCCEQDTAVIKVKTEVQDTTVKVVKFSFFTEFILHNYFGAVFSIVPFDLHQFTSNEAVFPILWKVPLYIKHCVYRL